tara:strand:+ start:115 stop:1008 length:894 start_codon:yes stop_codon:yes gene_type:complete
MTYSPTLCVFANFFIDNDERLQRMKDSFYSFCDVMPEEWKINIRGRLKYHASDFLHSELGENVDIYFLESPKGWFFDSHSFMIDVKSDYIFFWIEDHICLVDPHYLRSVVNDMFLMSVDQLRYSWFHASTFQSFQFLPVIDSTQFICSYQLDKRSSNITKQSLGRDFYSVSVVSIFKKDFFLLVLTSNRPYLKRWPKHLPFDFEKMSSDSVAPLIKTALPKKELFAAIDDDHGNIGYSLISRGQYPNRITRDDLKDLEFGVGRFRKFLQFLPHFLLNFIVNAYVFGKRLVYTFFYYI